MKKPLQRIKNNESVLGGVTQGLGEYFEIDPVIFRVIFVVLFFTPFPAFITYLILWIVLPEYNTYLDYSGDYSKTDYQTSNFTAMRNRNNTNGSLVGGIILIVLGSIFAFRTFFDINLFSYIGQMWPLFLIGLGVWLIIRERDKSSSHPSTDEPKTENTETF